MIDFTPPKDVFPRRNLGPGEEWGREVETRVVKTENVLGSLSQLLKGENRTSASSMAQLGRQVQELEDLYNAIPKIHQTTAEARHFGTVGGWQTLVIADVFVPEGATLATVALYGVLWMKADMGAGTLIQAQSRVVIGGVAGPAFNTSADAYDPGLGATNAPQFSRTFGVAPGGVFQISLQVNPASHPAYPPQMDNYAIITAITSFSAA